MSTGHGESSTLLVETREGFQSHDMQTTIHDNQKVRVYVY